MARTRRYKRAENLLVKKVSNFFKGIAGSVIDGFVGFIRFGRQKMTIMVVPHSQKKSMNFQVSIFSIAGTFIFFIAVFVFVFLLASKSILVSEKLANLKAETKKTQASLDVLKNETADLIKSSNDFKETLSETLTSLGLESVMATHSSLTESDDLSTLFDVKEDNSGISREAADLKLLASYLRDSVKPVQEMGKILNSQAALVSDIPSLWPIKGGIGRVTMGFGQNRHPFTQKWYIHQGIDIATGRPGDPIIATADGQVVTVEYHPGWGNYIIIKHKHGFYTRYAHLQSHRVQRGEYVQQGQTIGYLGNTGISTGAHLHYEVHIGSDLVDPAKYLNIKTGR
ncbi:MAG: peptidase M23 [Treponema sp.]|nr:MAG: peptidase M23 [Treponema sp.]